MATKVYFHLLGQNYFKARKLRKLTIEEVSNHLKIDHGYVSKIENGSIVPNIGILRRLASYYCCDLRELLLPDEDVFVGVSKDFTEI